MRSAQAIPANFSRSRKGDDLIEQEMNRLLELDQKHHSSRPLLTQDGRIRTRNPETGVTEIGMEWSELVQRAPQFFSLEYTKIRGRKEYGVAVHGHFARVAKLLALPPHNRTVPWKKLKLHIFFVFRIIFHRLHLFAFFSFFFSFDRADRNGQEFLKLVRKIPEATVNSIEQIVDTAGPSKVK